MPMKLVSSVTVGSGGAAQIAFNNIPQTGNDLFLLVSARTNGAGDFREIRLTLGNSVTGTNHNARVLQGYGSIFSFDVGAAAYVWCGYVPGNSFDADVFGNLGINMVNYTGSTNKAVSIDNSYSGAAAPVLDLIAGDRRTTAAITDLILSTQSTDNFVQNSIASLYIIS